MLPGHSSMNIIHRPVTRCFPSTSILSSAATSGQNLASNLNYVSFRRNFWSVPSNNESDGLLRDPGAMINIILADDHSAVRKGLKALLGTEPDFKIVGEAENGREALELVEKLQPDILLLDLMMPVLGGLEVTRLLCQKPCHTRVVILSMHNSEGYVIEALRLGAFAYILKDSSAEELIKGIRQVGGGKRFLCAQLSCKSLDDYNFTV